LEGLEPRQLLAAPADDRYEDNDLPRITKAAVLAAPSSPNLGLITGTTTIPSLALLDSADWYRFKLGTWGGENDYAKITFKPSQGDLDIRITGAGGQVTLASSTGTGGSERISLNGFSPGWYFLKVEGKAGATNPSYKLTFQTPTPEAGDDTYENNDTPAIVDLRPEGAAYSANLGAIGAPRTLSGLKMLDTYDVFKFRLTATGPQSSFLKVNATDPLDMVLLDDQGRPVRSSEAYLGQTRISLAGLAAGAYYVQVSHYALGTPASAPYSLTWSV
jgi:hypothetical protein